MRKAGVADKVIDRAHGGALGINLRHLRAFSAVAAAGSAAGAAEELFRVSSAVTRAVSELENALGRSLFDRRDLSGNAEDAGDRLCESTLGKENK